MLLTLGPSRAVTGASRPSCETLFGGKTAQSECHPPGPSLHCIRVQQPDEKSSNTFLNFSSTRFTVMVNMSTQYCRHIIIIIIIIIIILRISFMQGIYNYIPETNHVPREHCVAAILM